jgi:hypothetical protein
MIESSLNDLYRSAVEAFPETRKRQHATDTIRITQLEWTPFLGMRTLFLKGLAQNSDGGEYQPIILFKNVKYHQSAQPGLVEIVASNERTYFLEKLGGSRNDVLLRCRCGDFFWRWTYADHLDHSLYGRNRRKYESLGVRPSINPTNAKGLCKHLMKFVSALKDSGVLLAY